MSTIPITDAIPLIKAAIEAALSPLVLSRQGGSGAPRLYYQRATPGAPLPCVVHQSQDNGGNANDFLDTTGWRGFWTIKALATDPTTADTWLAALVSGMESLASPSGYTITTRQARPLTIPPTDQVWQAAHLYTIWLYRN